MKSLFIFDIDGTLADCSHRLKYIHCETPDWDKFFDSCPDDTPIEDVIALCRTLAKTGYLIVLITGRPARSRAATLTWLENHDVHAHELFMRADGDHRLDAVLKKEILDRLRTSILPEWTIEGVFEDRDQVVEMYRAEGLRVYQVAKGTY